MKPQLPHVLYRRQMAGLMIFGAVAAVLQAGLSYFNSSNGEALPPLSFSSEATAAAPALVLAEFNPNELDEKQWRSLGFSERQTATILKYKMIVGGAFTSKEQFRKCYAVSPEKYAQLQPYLLLPKKKSKPGFANTFKTFEKKELKIPGRFNPDQFTEADFVKMGFSERQAAAILKYKNYLGGSFVSKEKFRECFIISEENYRKMAPYLVLPDKTPAAFAQRKSFAKPERQKISYQNFDPNALDLEGWRNLGFSEKQAAVIVNYRDRNLRGSFKTLEDIQRCFVISEDKFEEIKPYIQLNPATIKTPAAYTKTEKHVDEPEVKTDFANVDLNAITFKQLREFGFDEKNAAFILSFRKKLGGFVNKQQLLDVYDTDRILTQKLIYSAQLSSSNVSRYSLVDAPEEWLKNHPYFKYYADKIIYYRISNPEERKIFKFLKLKPEQEEKMRLYLK